jgi:hypothetical protein
MPCWLFEGLGLELPHSTQNKAAVRRSSLPRALIQNDHDVAQVAYLVALKKYSEADMLLRLLGFQELH